MTTAFLRRYYAGGGTSTTLANSMASTDTTFTITSATGWPGASGFFIVVVDRGTSSEEKIRCASNSGTTVTVASDGNGGRGFDGTSATTHNSNATVSLCGGAIDFDESNQISHFFGSQAEGSLFYGKGTGTLPAALAVGSNGQMVVTNGTDPSWAYPFPSTTVSSNTNLAINTSYKVSSGSPTLTLPAPVAGIWIKVTNYGSGVPVISHNASEVIYGLGMTSAGVSSFSLGTYGATATVESDGTSWYVTSEMQESGWLTVGNGSMSNSWVNGSPAFGYRLTGNRVYLRGLLTSGTAAGALTLPSGYRPSTAINFTFAGNSSGTWYYGVISVSTAGALAINSGTAYATVGAGGVIFDGLSFAVD